MLAANLSVYATNAMNAKLLNFKQQAHRCTPAVLAVQLKMLVRSN